jgi:hypothetical protein
MSPFLSRDTFLALDMAGCPNRCRHCWLGALPNRRKREDDLRCMVQSLRSWVRPGETSSFFHEVEALTWFREPDYATARGSYPGYRRLYELERELNGRPPTRFELLSIWRLAHDEEYARWAREVGTTACQISFFGLEETQDWFCRRRGAFRDSLLATTRLLEAGIRPRWQLFLTTRILPDLDGLLSLVDDLRLRERTTALGGEFQLFTHTPGPDGEAWAIEHLRPTVDDLARVPAWLVRESERYLGYPLGAAEGDLVEHMSQELAIFPSAHGYPERLGFYVTASDDVYSNIAELTPWWRLGNLRRDALGTIVANLEENRVPGLWAMYHVPVAELARRYGRRDSRVLYDPGDLRARWLRLWCQEHGAHAAHADHGDQEGGPL